MKADQLNAFDLLSEQLVVPELGGDGAIVVRPISFGRKVQLTDVQDDMRAVTLVADCVHDEDGAPLMSADRWDAFALRHQEAFITVLAAAKRVSGFVPEAGKKDSPSAQSSESH